MVSDLYEIDEEDISLLMTYFRHKEGLWEFLAATKGKIVEYFGDVQVILSLEDDIQLFIQIPKFTPVQKSLAILDKFDDEYWLDASLKFDVVTAHLEYK